MKLNTKSRNAISDENFALPGRRYPIEDASHARNALSRVAQNGSPEEKSEVRSKVHSKYPDMGVWGKAVKKFAEGGEVGPDDAELMEKLRSMGVDPENLQHLPEVEAAAPEIAAPSPMAQLAEYADRGGAARGAAVGDGMGESVPMRALASDDVPDTEAATTQPNAPLVPASTKENVLSIRDQLQKFLGQQTGSINHMQELANLYKDQLAKENDRPDMRGTNALADHYWGTNFAKTFAPPLKPSEQTAKDMENQGAVNKQRQPVTQDLLKQYGTDNNAVAKEQANYYRGLSSSEKERLRLAKQENDLTTKMHDDMFFKRGTNPQVSQSINKLQRATSAIALMDKIPESGPIPGEMSNIASNLAGLASGGNVITNEKLREILPANVDLTMASIKQWLTSEPQGADQQEFMKRFRREIDGEVRAARNTLSNYQDSQADSYLGRVPEAVHQQQYAAGKRFLQHSYYDPDNPTGYLGQAPASAAAAPKVGAPSTEPPAPGAKPVKNSKTGEKAWLMPDGTRRPRK